jgi:hypothetical protein
MRVLHLQVENSLAAFGYLQIKWQLSGMLIIDSSCVLSEVRTKFVCAGNLFFRIVHFAMWCETTMDCFLYKYSGIQVSTGICTVETCIRRKKCESVIPTLEDSLLVSLFLQNQCYIMWWMDRFWRIGFSLKQKWFCNLFCEAACSDDDPVPT